MFRAVASLAPSTPLALQRRCGSKKPKKSATIASREKELRTKLSVAGPVTGHKLFIAKAAKEVNAHHGRVDLMTLNARWAALDPVEKAPYEREAAANLAKRRGIRKSLKKPASRYASFMKEHFAAEYQTALLVTPDRNEAFKRAATAVADLYKTL